MIKVIKEGNPHKYKATCGECGCEIEYAKSDVVVVTAVYSYVICPCCESHIPHDWVKNLIKS